MRERGAMSAVAPEPRAARTPAPYRCPTCDRVSYHPEDARHRFCAVCGFESDPLALRQARAAAADPSRQKTS